MEQNPKSNEVSEIVNWPLHQHLGIRDIKVVDGEASCELEVSDNNTNPNGTFHGGVIYLLCDVVAYTGLSTVLDKGTTAVTHDIHVSVIRPAFKGDKIKVQTKIINKGRSLCFLETEIVKEDKVIAKAKITKSIVAT